MEYPVNKFTKHLDDVNGYILVFDVDEFALNWVEKVIAYNPVSDYRKTVSGSTELEQLLGYPGYHYSDEVPELAFNLSTSTLYIFFRSDVFPYESTRFSLVGYRNTFPVKSLDDYIDVPENALELFLKMITLESIKLSGKKVPAELQREVNELKQKWESENDLYK